MYLLKNKYSVSAIILLGLLGTDILLHKGMSRVMLAGNFTDKITSFHLPVCENNLLKKEKTWIKAINTTSLMKQLPTTTNGIECDVYFDTKTNCFKVYHDSTALSNLVIDSLLDIYQSQKLDANIWLDFKNLDSVNSGKALIELNRLKIKYQLNNKLIIESSSAKQLKQYCDSGYFTSYYVPYFNPYEVKEEKLIHFIDSIKSNLKMYPTSALSGYYFQYPILKKCFPDYPILTWADRSSASLVSYFFSKQLNNDSMIKVVLFPAN